MKFTDNHKVRSERPAINERSFNLKLIAACSQAYSMVSFLPSTFIRSGRSYFFSACGTT